MSYSDYFSTSDMLFKDPSELSARAALEEFKRDYYANKDWPPKPDFDRDWFEQQCQKIKGYINDLYDNGEIPNIASLHDPRVQVITRYFITYTEGKIDIETVFLGAKETLNRVWVEDLGAALFGLEVAMNGFLAAYRPDLAEGFAHAAAETARRLKLPPATQALIVWQSE